MDLSALEFSIEKRKNERIGLNGVQIRSISLEIVILGQKDSTESHGATIKTERVAKAEQAQRKNMRTLKGKARQHNGPVGAAMSSKAV